MCLFIIQVRWWGSGKRCAWAWGCWRFLHFYWRCSWLGGFDPPAGWTVEVAAAPCPSLGGFVLDSVVPSAGGGGRSSNESRWSRWRWRRGNATLLFLYASRHLEPCRSSPTAFSSFSSASICARLTSLPLFSLT